ncbi:MAG TPA: cytochrome c-type biogenesis CcmF C-terminal domain-containing protein, partial [Gaiellaceae bacterium]|nr:cytochrome c-type biogenesis CcmF C-terminal domain-containing protein [Gaiellaceae bacterium]
VFFALLVTVVASPFATQAAPADGAGMTASLQNPYMLAHPPLLYLGYVGLTIPFAFAMAALLSRRADERWIVATRRWTLGAWTFLGVGILLGAKWAYEEVGWGGWYAWDPVENAALMPWLVATAFLHSVMVQEKKNMLRVWNVVLVAGAFALSLFGTFLTRSGVISSIHSFTQSSIGPFFLGFIVVVLAFSIALILWRLPDLRARTRLESLVSREAAFLYNNLFLVALALTVLWGVVYPLVSEAVRGVAVSVGAPYYDFFAIVFGLPLVLLMGIGPVVAWRRASLRALGSQLAWPAAVALLTGAALLLAGAGSSLVGLVGYTLAAFVLTTIVLEFVRGTRARKALGRGGWWDAFAGLVGRNRRRYGGYVVHAAIALLLVGAVGIGGFSSAGERRLAPGESLVVADYRVTYLGTQRERGPNAEEVRASLAVERNGRDGGTMEAGKNSYFAEEQTSNEVGIRTDWLRAEDLFVIADQFNADGSVYLKVIVNPLVNLIWLSGLVFLLGSVVAMWPDAREQRRLAQRFAGEGALARA